jgi:hypothetical protein
MDGEGQCEPHGARGTDPTPAEGVLTDTPDGRTNVKSPDPARSKAWQTHRGCNREPFLTGRTALNRGHPYDDRSVGCRAVTAEKRRQAGWRGLPLGGLVHLASSNTHRVSI